MDSTTGQFKINLWSCEFLCLLIHLFHQIFHGITSTCSLNFQPVERTEARTTELVQRLTTNELPHYFEECTKRMQLSVCIVQDNILKIYVVHNNLKNCEMLQYTKELQKVNLEINRNKTNTIVIAAEESKQNTIIGGLTFRQKGVTIQCHQQRKMVKQRKKEMEEQEKPLKYITH